MAVQDIPEFGSPEQIEEVRRAVRARKLDDLQKVVNAGAGRGNGDGSRCRRRGSFWRSPTVEVGTANVLTAHSYRIKRNSNPFKNIPAISVP